MALSHADRRPADRTDGPLLPGVSVVVPVYNSERTLDDLLANLARVLPGAARSFEVVLVNDGSRDRSGRVLEELAARYGWVRAIHLSRNFGQHNATLCGVRAARFDVVVTMDDDLQHPAENIPLLLAKLDQGYDVVYGTPERDEHGFWRRLASAITKIALQSAMGVETARGVSALRAFRTSIRNAFAEYRSPYVSIDVLLTWGTSRFGSLVVRQEPRTVGTSQYTLGRLLAHALNMMTGFSVLPLQLASLVGFFFTLFGFAVLLFVLGRYLISGASVPGFPFLASVVVIFSGAQLFALGIMGEYLARIHLRIMDRPAYVVRDGAEDAAGR
jgi:undecaprenyl-phosphate 4-deoxy-4-formamido-L-arabinose transferase